MDENRRHDYRHQFGKHERIRVELEAPRQKKTLFGFIVNLSLGGMLVELEDQSIALAKDEECRAHFSIPSDGRPVVFDAVVIRAQPLSGIVQHSFHFLPLADPVEEEKREKNLWQFLMEEQRRRSRILRSREKKAK